MANVYVCRIRTDIPAATLQLTDLRPNSSQYSIYQAPARGFYATTIGGTADASAYGQSGYLSLRYENDTLAALSGADTVASYNGLAAYIIDNVIDQNTAVTILFNQANAAAIAIGGILDNGTDLTSTEIDAELATAVGGGAGTCTINSGGSTGSVADVLKILSGARYNLPSGSTVGALAAAASVGSFDYMVDDRAYRQLYDSAAFQSSLNQGCISVFNNALFAYEELGSGAGSVAGAAITVYDSAGTAL